MSRKPARFARCGPGVADQAVLDHRQLRELPMHFPKALVPDGRTVCTTTHTAEPAEHHAGLAHFKPGTNLIESINARLRRVTRNRGQFPSEPAVLKVLCNLFRGSVLRPHLAVVIHRGAQPQPRVRMTQNLALMSSCWVSPTSACRRRSVAGRTEVRRRREDDRLNGIRDLCG